MDWSEALSQAIMNRPLLGYGAAYLGGVLATASPCSLASIPLIIGFVGGYAEGNKRQAFIYSVIFVVGLAIGMAALGANSFYLKPERIESLVFGSGLRLTGRIGNPLTLSYALLLEKDR